MTGTITTEFTIPYPKEPKYKVNTMREPQRTDPEFNPKPSIAIKLSKRRMFMFESDNELKYKDAHAVWKSIQRRVIAENQALEKEYRKKVEEWENRGQKQDFKPHIKMKVNALNTA